MNCRRGVVFVAVLSTAACKPILKNPIDLGNVVAARALSGVRPALAWHVETRAPRPARTDAVTLPAGSAAAFVTVGGSDIPAEQLLTEGEQRRIAEVLLAAVSASASVSTCSARVVFDGVDYVFHEHQYWADVSMIVSADGATVFDEHHRFWSADGMSTWQRMNTTPQKGKQALAVAILDHFVDSANASARFREACSAR